MIHPSKRLLRSLLLVALPLESCTTCHDTVVNQVSNGDFIARSVHRVCGSSSGFSVQVYPRTGKPPGEGEGCLEPFKSVCRCPKAPPPGSNEPLRLRWAGTASLVVEWDDCLPPDLFDRTPKQTPTKADRSYLGVNITYIPALDIPTPEWCKPSL